MPRYGPEVMLRHSRVIPIKEDENGRFLKYIFLAQELFHSFCLQKTCKIICPKVLVPGTLKTKLSDTLLEKFGTFWFKKSLGKYMSVKEMVNSILPARFFCRPEVAYIRIKY